MRAVALFSVLCFCCLVERSSSFDNDKLINNIVKLAFIYIETFLKKTGSIHLVSKPSQLNLTSKGTLEGTLSCNNVVLYGLGGLEVNKNNLIFELNSTNRTLNFGLNISIPNEVGFSIENYSADVGLFNKVPIYGNNGNILLSLKSMNLHIYTELSYPDKFHVDKFDLKPAFLAKISISKFWNNDELTPVVSALLNGLVDVLMLLWNLEEKCFSCAAGSLIESLVNRNLDFLNALTGRCQDTCFPSSSVLSTVLNIDINEFLENIHEVDDIVNHVEKAKAYLTARIENNY